MKDFEISVIRSREMKTKEVKIEAREEQETFLQKQDPNDEVIGYLCFQDNRIIKGFTNIRFFGLLYGIVGFLITATYAYNQGVLTTVEKRFKIPSRNMGVINSGTEIVNVCASWFISYYGGKGHRPRIIGIGLIGVVIQCFLMGQGHFMFGPGNKALSLTEEYQNGTITDENKIDKLLCHLDGRLFSHLLYYYHESFLRIVLDVLLILVVEMYIDV